MAPAMGTITLATEPSGIKKKTESNTIAAIMKKNIRKITNNSNNCVILQRQINEI